ncbi:MAG: VacJ family lipoprotein [Thalassolituus oleivorans]|uniref:MlaA family lipoprotein n=1 Tax=Thalassolituus oleivorans TaxID=187493 RepID=UPI001B6EC1BE|nr:VacJ family lipoprotein [Thalassolituus oleivorans]MBQ0726458.1 VacJ family lipoprotein [Thalassolituus oleivorans]MBQ0781179.1 VacJ family lipoprotein [Thalassolituus oleivorans]
MKAKSALSALPSLFALAICSVTSPVVALEDNNDPWEGFNRKVFAFNDGLDRYVLRPVAVGYNYITPEFVDNSVTSMYSNAGEVLVVANDVAQFKLTQALSDTARFIINSTVGFFGVFDVASSIGLERHDEDFGQTLGYWGVGSGPYIVLPFLGPRTVRDVAGNAVDYSSNLSYAYFGNNYAQDAALLGLKIVDLRSDLIASEGLISGDKYIFFRSAYLQRREYLINDGVSEDAFDDEFDVFGDE